MPTARDVIAGRAAWAVDHADTCGWAWRLPKASVHCVVTSPPYLGLRDYGLPPTEWPEIEYTPVAGLPPVVIPATTCCLGLEPTPEAFTAHLVDVFRGLRRALHPSGVVWLNLGDSFAANTSGGLDGSSLTKGGRQTTHSRGAGRRPDGGLPSKNLIGVPWRVAFALQADGWYLRQWCPWVKRNPMPESADDRPSTACETVFLFSKSPTYFFDMQAVSRPVADANAQRTTRHYNTADRYGADNGGNSGLDDLAARMRSGEHDTRNFRSADLWFGSVGMLMIDGELVGIDQPTTPYKDAHFATFPPRLVLPMVLAGTSERGVCPECGEQWRRVVERERVRTRPGTNTKVPGFGADDGRKLDGFGKDRSKDKHVGHRDPYRHVSFSRTVGWEPGCGCNVGEPVPAVVADPFAGSGTVLAVAHERNRRAVGCELNEDYVRMAEKRVGRVISGLI